MSRVSPQFSALLLTVCAASALCGPAAAHDNTALATNIVAGCPAQFFVSAILRRNDQSLSIKLVHGLETAATEDTAVGQFTRKALDEFQDYAILQTLATPVPTTCTGRFAWVPRPEVRRSVVASF